MKQACSHVVSCMRKPFIKTPLKIKYKVHTNILECINTNINTIKQEYGYDCPKVI